MAATQRRGAYASGMLTLAVFLIPALMAPGPVEVANIAGVALAIWLAVDAWRIYGRHDLKATLPYRISPVAPGLLGSAAMIFVIALLIGWQSRTGVIDPQLYEITRICQAFWDFPFSPVAMLARPNPALPTISAETIQTVTVCLSAAIGLGLIFGLFTLIGRISRRDTLRRHAVLWRGGKSAMPENRLAQRGARGLKPVRSADYGIAGESVSGRLALRALSMTVAIVFLPYAPLFLRFIAGSGFPQVEAFFASPFVDNSFFNIWLIGLWSMIITSAIILFFAYIRLALALRVR